MAIATQHLTLEDYLQSIDGTNTTHELVKGELLPMALGMGQHGEIADFINSNFHAEIKRSPEEA